MTEVLSNGDSKELKTVHLLHLSFTDVGRGVCLCLLFSDSGFADFEQ